MDAWWGVGGGGGYQIVSTRTTNIANHRTALSKEFTGRESSSMGRGGSGGAGAAWGVVGRGCGGGGDGGGCFPLLF